MREGAQTAEIFGAEPSHRGAGSVRAGHAVSAARPEARGLGGAHGFPVAVSKPGVAEPGFGAGIRTGLPGRTVFRTGDGLATVGRVRRGMRGRRARCESAEEGARKIVVRCQPPGQDCPINCREKEGSAIGRTPLFVRTVRERFRICDSRRVEKARCPSLFGRDGSVGVLRFRCGRDGREPAVRDAGACNAAKHTVARGLLGASEADRRRMRRTWGGRSAGLSPDHSRPNRVRRLFRGSSHPADLSGCFCGISFSRLLFALGEFGAAVSSERRTGGGHCMPVSDFDADVRCRMPDAGWAESCGGRIKRHGGRLAGNSPRPVRLIRPVRLA